jgi:hypothetical protein
MDIESLKIKAALASGTSGWSHLYKEMASHCRRPESSVLTGNFVLGFDKKNRQGNLILLRPVPNVISLSISEGNHDKYCRK